MRGPAERVHGGLFGLDPAAHATLARAERVVDFSVNLNPYGPPPALLAAARDAALDRYPDPSARAARMAWAETLDVGPEHIAVGHGAADLFWALARALIAPGERVVMLEPTFSEFRLAAQAAGARVESVVAAVGEPFARVAPRLRELAQGARALYLCAPNNPTGTHVSALEVRALAEALPETCIVLDQSFLALSDHAHEQRLRLPDNVVCVRSLTKDFALAGLRIGLLLAAPRLVQRLEQMRPTWSTSAPAQAAIAAAAGAHAFVRESWARMRDDRAAVAAALSAHGFSPLPSATAYQLVQVSDARRFCQRLWTHGVVARDCSSFGLPGYVRLAARPRDEVAQLARALSAL